MSLIEIRDACFAYDRTRMVFRDVSFSLEKGQLVTILGPNGAGKSSLLNCVGNLTPLTSGRILLDGKELASFSPRGIARKLAYVTQVSSPMFGYSVRDYVAMGRAPHLGLLSKPGKRDYEIVDDTIRMMGIGHIARHSYINISGGERQLVDISRAIVQDTELILFDEPTSALDYGNQLRIMRIVKNLSSRGYSIIMTTHNPDHPILLEGRVGVMDREGRLRIGTVDEIMKEDYLSEIYGTRMRLVFVDDVERLACISEKL